MPCVPTAQSAKPASDQEVRTWSVDMYLKDNDNVYEDLTVKPGISKKKGHRYFWMLEQTYFKDPNTSWPPSSKGLLPISYNAVFTDIGAFLSRIKFQKNLYLLIRMHDSNHIKAFTVTPIHSTSICHLG